MIGLFAASNLFLFYIFWELMIVPLFLLIGGWGGAGRVYAAVKFLLFTLAGSVLMLVGMVALYNTFGTLDFRALAEAGPSLQPGQQAWLFAAFLAAFAVKVPMFPVHTWLPDAHTEAPTAGSVILAGILLKMGAYGFLRVSLPILPEAVQLFVTTHAGDLRNRHRLRCVRDPGPDGRQASSSPSRASATWVSSRWASSRSTPAGSKVRSFR